MSKIIFFHVPECAGTIVENSFIRYFGSESVLAPATIDNYRIIPPDFMKNYKVLAGHVTHDYAIPYLKADTVLLTLLRDPATRIRSLYNYYKVAEELNEAIILAKELDFDQWINSSNPSIKIMIENAVTRSFTPESYWRVDAPACPELIIRYSRLFLQSFSAVGFTDNVGVFFNQIENLTGVKIKNDELNADLADYTFSSVSEREMDIWIENNCDLDLVFYQLAKEIFSNTKLRTVRRVWRRRNNRPK